MFRYQFCLPLRQRQWLIGRLVCCGRISGLSEGQLGRTIAIMRNNRLNDLPQIQETRASEPPILTMDMIGRPGYAALAVMYGGPTTNPVSGFRYD